MPLFRAKQQTPIATWIGTRYFAVDYDGGDDRNTGHSDISLADAGIVAIKTLENLKLIFPRFGNGQIAVIGVKSRAGGATYRTIDNTADDFLDISGVTGYQNLVIRGTGTQATATSVAFANDTADKTFCGAQILSGTNAAGYNPTGAISARQFDVQLAGGGAPGLAAEPTLIGKRIRFDAATTTVLLRNTCSGIYQNTTNNITVMQNLFATPVASDVFYIEEPAVAVAGIDLGGTNNGYVAANPQSLSAAGVTVAGFKCVNGGSAVVNAKNNAQYMRFSFIDIPISTSYSAFVATCQDLRIQNTYTDELASPATITPGTGVRSNGGITPSLCYNLILTHSVTITGRYQILGMHTFNIGGGCYGQQGMLLQGCGASNTAVSNVSGATLGNSNSTLTRPFRSVGPFIDAITVSRSNVWINGCDLTGNGASPCIKPNGVGLQININGVVGSTGNTGIGLDLSSARLCMINMGNLVANTFTGAAERDIGSGANGPFYVHADYARTDLWDQFGNHIIGPGQVVTGTTTLLTNNAVANVGQYAITRATGAAGLVQAAQANTAANAAGVAGVSQSAFTSAGPQSAMHVIGGSTWVQFDVAPTIGSIAYLSTATAGNAQVAVPALAGTNQKLRLGRVIRVSGTLGLVAWHPETLAVLADGLA